MSVIDPRGTTFRPKYRIILYLGLVMFMFTSAVMATGAYLIGASGMVVAGLLLLPVPPVVVFLWRLVYSAVEFQQDRLILRRYIFPDVVVPYGAVEDISLGGMRTESWGVSWEIMRNGDELASRFEGLQEHGLIQEEQLSGELEAETEANRKAGAIVVGLICGVFGGLGAGAGIDVFRWEVILAAFIVSLVGTPVLARLFRNGAQSDEQSDS